jgi:hypothetical protein
MRIRGEDRWERRFAEANPDDPSSYVSSYEGLIAVMLCAMVFLPPINAWVFVDNFEIRATSKAGVRCLGENANGSDPRRVDT